jgi:hypothetical protein
MTPVTFTLGTAQLGNRLVTSQQSKDRKVRQVSTVLRAKKVKEVPMVLMAVKAKRVRQVALAAQVLKATPVAVVSKDRRDKQVIAVLKVLPVEVARTELTVLKETPAKRESKVNFSSSLHFQLCPDN